MAKAKIPRPKLTLIVDSNILYTKNDTELISTSFIEALTKLYSLASVDLAIPRIVLQEIVAQKATKASHLFSSVSRDIATLAKLSSTSAPTIEPPSLLTRRIQRRLLQWCNDYCVETLRVPFDSIVWKHLVRDAVWRIPPFSSVQEEKEKGFKDYLILQSILALCRKRRTRLAFVSNDKLLVQTVSKQAQSFNQLQCYASMEDLESWLTLISSRLPEQFVSDLTRLAPSAFYTPGDDNCLFSKYDLLSRIKKAFATRINALPQLPPALVSLFAAGLGTLVSQVNAWKPIPKEHVFITFTRFSFRDGEKFYFKTGLDLAQPYIFQHPSIPIAAIEFIRLSHFEIQWNAVVDGEAFFTNAELGVMMSRHGELIQATTETLRRYGFDTPILLLAETLRDDGLRTEVFEPPSI